MIPDSTQLGVSDAETWRAVPAQTNPNADEMGAWAVVAGDGEEADVYLDVTAEYPRQVAEFVASAVRGEATRRRFAGAIADVQAELDRLAPPASPVTDPVTGSVTARSPYLPDTARLAVLVDHVGALAREVAAGVADGHALAGGEAAKRLYAEVTQVAAAAVGWMEVLLAREPAE